MAFNLRIIFTYVILIYLCHSSIGDQDIKKIPDVILNIVTGGSFDKLNLVGNVNHHYYPKLTDIAKAIDNETCPSTNLLDALSKVLNKKGLINIDLRDIIKDHLPDSKLMSNLSSEEMTNIARRVNEVKTIPMDKEALKTETNLTINKDQMIEFQEFPSKGNMVIDSEVLTNKGANIDSVQNMIGKLNRMFAIDTGVDIPQLYMNPSLQHYYQKLNRSLRTLTLFSSNKYPVNPMEICSSYIEARTHLSDRPDETKLFLLKTLRDSISAFIDIIKYKKVIKSVESEQDSYQQDQSTKESVENRPDITRNNLVHALMKEDLLQKQAMIKSIQNDILSLSNWISQGDHHSHKISKRSFSYYAKLSKGMFTGYILSDEMDLTPSLEKILTHQKLHISESVFSNDFWPSCSSFTEEMKAKINKANHPGVLLAFIENGGICFFHGFCNTGSGLDFNHQCKPSAGISRDIFTNIQDLSISDYIHKIGSLELDSSLEKDLSGYCMVGNMKISTCKNMIHSYEMMTIARLEGEWIIMKDGVHLGYNSDVRVITSYDCTATNITMLYDPSTPGFISGCRSGDENYLKHFTGARDCSCAISTKSGDLSVKYYNNLVPVDFLFHINISVYHPSDVEMKKTCSDCEFVCSNGYLKITNNPKYDLLSICKYGQCEYFSIQDQKQEFRLKDPKPLLGNVKVMLYPNNTDLESYSETISCSIDNFCDLINCVFCWDMMMNPRCNPWMAILVWSIAFIIPLTFINLIMGLFKGISKIMKLTWKLLLGLFWTFKVISKAFSRCYKRRINTAYTKLVDLEEGEVEEDTVIYRKTTERNLLLKRNSDQIPRQLKPIVLKPVNPLTFTIILIILLPLSQTCSIESFIQSESMHCEDQNGKSICLIKQDVQLSVAPIGQISCINIRRYENSPVVSQLQIKTKSLRLACEPSSHYYTVTTRPSISTTYRCPGAGSCQEATCKSIKSDAITDEIPNKKLFNLLGDTGCRLVTGFWGNTCFLANSACKFYRVFFEPVGDTYEVFDCPLWDWMAELEITIINDDSTKEIVFLSSSIPYIKDHIRIRLTSVSLKPSLLYNKCFLRKSNIKYEGDPIAVTECNRNTEAVVGKVGEIQCPTASDADLMNLRCSKISGLYSVSVTGNDVIFKHNVLNVDNIYKNSLLPRQYNDITLRNTKDGVPFTETHNAGLFTLHISLDAYKVTISEQTAECGSSFLNVSGCYRCDTGARVCLDTTASSYPAVMSIDCLGSHQQLASIYHKGHWCFNMAFKKESVNTKCVTSCGKKKQEFEIKGTLVYTPDILPTYSNGTVIENEVTESFLSSFCKWIISLSWQSYGLILISLLISLFLTYLLLFVLLPMSIRCLNNWKRGRNHKKTRKLDQYEL